MIQSVVKAFVANKRVILRAGFDVPLGSSDNQETVVADDARIQAGLPTIRHLIDKGAKIILISHLDRPGGEWVPQKSLWPVAKRLAELLNYKLVKTDKRLPDYPVPHLIFLTENIVKTDCSKLTKRLKAGDILMLENLRFYKEEEANADEFAEVLAKFGDLVVFDAFSVAHHRNVSTVGLLGKINSYGGLSLLKEIAALDKVMHRPERPLVLIMGGSKISDKIEALENLAPKAEKILIGGALANSFLSARGYETGQSKTSDIVLAKQLLLNYREKIVLPFDVVVAKNFKTDPRITTVDKLRPGESIYDIGPQTLRAFKPFIFGARTVIWNGPLGLIEEKKFSYGSLNLARLVAVHARTSAYVLVGGGESLEVLDRAHVTQFIDYVSTAGGAMLEYLAGKKLPALLALEKQ